MTVHRKNVIASPPVYGEFSGERLRPYALAAKELGAKYDIPVVFAVFNDGCLGMVDHGFQRVYAILEAGVTFATYADRFELAPQPLFGGVSGRTAEVMVERAGETIRLASKQSFALRRGDRLIMRTGGGAGYGEPSRRDPRSVRDDDEMGLAALTDAG